MKFEIGINLSHGADKIFLAMSYRNSLLGVCSMCHYFVRVLVLFVFISTLNSVLAAEENADVYAFSKLSRVSNLFRLADDTEALNVLGTTNRDDTLTTIGVGGHLKIPVSRQRYTIAGELRRTNYNSFDQLDNSNGEIKAIWDWQVGSLWSGQLGYDYREAISDFTEFQQQVKDTQKRNRAYFSGTFHFHPRWWATVGLDTFDTSFDRRSTLDRRESSVFGEVLFATRADTRVGISVRETNGDLNALEDIDPGASTQFINNDYDESVINAVAIWEVSGISTLRAELGRTKRDHDQVSGRDFSGVTGRVAYQRQVSGKTDVEISVFRGTTTRDEVSSLVVTQGFSIKPQWRITPKLRFDGTLSYEEGDFEGSASDAVNFNAVRRDEVARFRGSLNYQFKRKISFFVGINNESRDSNQANAEFDFYSVDVGARIRL